MPLANLGSADDGWRIALARLQHRVAACCLVVWLLLQRQGGGAPRPTRRATVPRLPWRSSGAWWLCAIFLLITILFYGLGAWLPDVLVEDGWSESSAGATLGVLNATHRRRHDPRRHARRAGPASRRALMVPATAFLVVGTLGIATYTDGGWLWAAACGAGIGTLFPTMMTLPIDVADRPEAVGAVAGLMLLVGYVGAAPHALAARRAARLDGLVRDHHVGAVRRRGRRAHGRERCSRTSAWPAAFRDAERVPQRLTPRRPGRSLRPIDGQRGRTTRWATRTAR